ncbi:uncharacterized protein BP5553_03575 [Venustampulla echinocandica]|uniref:Uncharacterized protein n=1 Tax=Venustampulla echinocandica TaxID=2656787 RepID=A0A370TUM3_9HELO|nr:uncharacterized protein BP5553_03575 [Venustampulla echinocandica]RDL39235.1 hypothetical protein BP5553_03575 [Venustampulla echinocandica]
MATFKRRFGAAILLVVFSLTVTMVFINRSPVSTQLESIGLGVSNHGLWGWGSGGQRQGDGEGGTRVVVFGDSWVGDGIEEGLEGKGKGKSWPDVVYDKLKCTSYLNFAASQPSSAFPPAGVIVSNEILKSAVAGSNSSSSTNHISETNLLPDLKSQIQSFINEATPSPTPAKTIFIISVGFWDIYNYAGLDLESAQKATDAAVNELFDQLDTLYSYYSRTVSSDNTTTHSPPFNIVVPKIMDPSLVPGWLSHRPTPPEPSNIAEHQRNAIPLTLRWNYQVEVKLKGWGQTNVTFPNKPPAELKGTPETPISNNNDPPSKEHMTVGKAVFYYDLAQYLIDIVIEHQLQDEGTTDAAGLGASYTIFEDIDRPCLRETEDEDDDAEDLVQVNGHWMCKYPKEYLFWDAFNIGSVANAGIGKHVADMVKHGRSLAGWA